MPEFKVGDIVISKKGTKPFRITVYRSGSYYVHGVYLHNNHDSICLKENLIPYNENTMANSDMTTLYSFEIDGQTKYGHHIATNSLGLCVVEEKGGSGQIYTLEKTLLQEVVPYTVHMREMNTSNSVNVITTEGTYKLNEMIIHSGRIWIVTKLNNKVKNGVELKNARRIVTEEIQ